MRRLPKLLSDTGILTAVSVLADAAMPQEPAATPPVESTCDTRPEGCSAAGTIALRATAGILAAGFWLLIIAAVWFCWLLLRGGFLPYALTVGYLLLQAVLYTVAAVSARIARTSLLLGIGTLTNATVAIAITWVLSDTSRSPRGWRHKAIIDLIPADVILGLIGIAFVVLTALTRTIPAPARVTRPIRIQRDRLDAAR